MLQYSPRIIAVIGIAFLAYAISPTLFAGARPAGIVQGWDDATAKRYHYESQGTRFIPAAMLEALRTPSGARFMDPSNLRRFGFIYDDVHASGATNPYGWPIGLAIDRDSNGIAMAGFTCAACHTTQLTYHGAVIRVEGAGANIDLAAFRKALAGSVIFAGSDPSRKAALEERAITLGFPRVAVRHAFDRILSVMESGAETPPEYVVETTPAGPGRTDALNAIATAVFSTDLGVPENAQKGDAPVRYPFLWDIWRFDWVQYNASVRQPMERNIGEALGVGLETHFVDPLNGKPNPEPRRWQTTARVRNLYWIEQALNRLSAPRWPQEIFGPIDRAKAARGATLFALDCARCHAIQTIAGTSPAEWHVPVIALNVIGTDPNQAADYAKHRFDATKLGLGKDVRTPTALAYVVERVKHQAYMNADIPKVQWPEYDGFGRTATMFPAPCGYKARPLTGVWATGPFLHNGSVPSIYDLLSETRPSTFWFGSHEFDPKKLGMVESETAGAEHFDSHLPGNSNAGHWFTNDRARPGRIGPALTESQKFALIEYLKSLTPENYPSRAAGNVPAAPCERDPQWADAM